ncbi:MAG: hypothetical protein LH660_12725 [Phormidesmis sp. CAN_BIN36]|nr:hypothetical protein [Phormidesmis sp. CAN_BIN36]
MIETRSALLRGDRLLNRNTPISLRLRCIPLGLAIALVHPISSSLIRSPQRSFRISLSSDEAIMTTEERLDRLEALAETTLLAVQQLAHQQESNHREMRTNISDVVSMITVLAQSADEDRAIMREMQGEIREVQGEVKGLQTENRRILDHLLNREELNE